MAKFSGPEEIYRELVDDSDESWILGLVAFAVIEEQRVEWMRHQESNNAGLPGPEEIREWYEQQSESVLLRAKGTAENVLNVYSNEVVESYLVDHQRSIEEGIVVGEIRDLKAFWPQFGVNLAGGFISALLFAALLTVVAFFVLNDASPVEIGREIRQQIEEQ
ncbi:hypothetical protein [Pseudovibrio sp. POLY-S9]|uniref:hypothetical protein n=1 Tax=Pseudovibrio sp. POLY-S9 TaxID=1576596 RepID=UPI00070ACF8E|nr:hypothetical protein [Pseudovibrio sp. POLY-S9]